MKVIKVFGVVFLFSLASCATLASTLGAATKEEMAAAQKEIAALQAENQALKENLAVVTSLGVEIAELKSVQEQLVKKSNALPKETLKLMIEILNQGLSGAQDRPPAP